MVAALSQRAQTGNVRLELALHPSAFVNASDRTIEARGEQGHEVSVRLPLPTTQEPDRGRRREIASAHHLP
jgi:hypothetical protein